MDEKVKQIKIDEDLFRMIYQYFIYGREDEIELIKAGLKDKMDKMILRNIYTESKTAESVEESEIHPSHKILRFYALKGLHFALAGGFLFYLNIKI